MTRERKSLIAGVGVLIFTVILAGVAVTAHNISEPEPEWLMVMNAETGEFQASRRRLHAHPHLEMLDAPRRCWRSPTGPNAKPKRGTPPSSWTTGRSEFGDDPPNAVVSARTVCGLRSR